MLTLGFVKGTNGYVELKNKGGVFNPPPFMFSESAIWWKSNYYLL